MDVLLTHARPSPAEISDTHRPLHSAPQPNRFISGILRFFGKNGAPNHDDHKLTVGNYVYTPIDSPLGVDDKGRLAFKDGSKEGVPSMPVGTLGDYLAAMTVSKKFFEHVPGNLLKNIPNATTNGVLLRPSAPHVMEILGPDKKEFIGWGPAIKFTDSHGREIIGTCVFHRDFDPIKDVEQYVPYGVDFRPRKIADWGLGLKVLDRPARNAEKQDELNRKRESAREVRRGGL